MAKGRLAIHTKFFGMGSSEMKAQRSGKSVHIPASDEKGMDMQSRWDQGVWPSINQLGALKRPACSHSPPCPSGLTEKARSSSRYREGTLGMKGLWPASGEGHLGFTACLRGEGQRFFLGFMACFRREGWREGENDLSSLLFSQCPGAILEGLCLDSFQMQNLKNVSVLPLWFPGQRNTWVSVSPQHLFSLLNILVLTVAGMLQEQTKLASESNTFSLGMLSWSYLKHSILVSPWAAVGSKVIFICPLIVFSA